MKVVIHLTFVYSRQKYCRHFAKFCGLLRIYELYNMRLLCFKTHLDAAHRPAKLKKCEDKSTIKINEIFGVFTSLFRLDLILCLTSNFVCKNTANFPLRSSKHKKRWWCVLYLKKGRKKDFVLGKNLRRR